MPLCVKDVKETMERKPKESDWKTFRNRVPEWRERYLRKKNKEIIRILTDENKTPTEQFWEAKEKMEKETKVFGGLPRRSLQIENALVSFSDASSWTHRRLRFRRIQWRASGGDSRIVQRLQPITSRWREGALRVLF